MSINSINQTFGDNLQNTVSVSSAVQSESSSTNKNSLYSNLVPNIAQDSININITGNQVAQFNHTLVAPNDSISISIACTLQIDSHEQLRFQREQAFIIDAYQANNSVASIVSFLHNSGFQALHTVRGLTSATVLNLVTE